MAKYSMEILAYQRVEVEADSLSEAIEKVLLIGVDTTCAEWKTRNAYRQEDGQ